MNIFETPPPAMSPERSEVVSFPLEACCQWALLAVPITHTHSLTFVANYHGRTMYIYCTEVHLFFRTNTNEIVKSAGEWTLTCHERGAGGGGRGGGWVGGCEPECSQRFCECSLHDLFVCFIA